MPHGGYRPGAGGRYRIAIPPCPEAKALEQISKALEMDRETVTRMMVRVTHSLITERGWEAINDAFEQLDSELAALRRPDGPEPPPTVPAEPMVEITLRNDLAINGIRYGPGRCLVSESMAAGLLLDDARRVRALRLSPVAQDRPLEA